MTSIERESDLVLSSPYRNGLRKWTFATCVFTVIVVALILWKTERAERAASDARTVATYNRAILNGRTKIINEVPGMQKQIEYLVSMEKRREVHGR